MCKSSKLWGLDKVAWIFYSFLSKVRLLLCVFVIFTFNGKKSKQMPKPKLPGNLWDGWAQGHGKWWWLDPDKKIYYDKNVDNTPFLTNELDKNNGIFKRKYRPDKINTEDLNLISGFPKGRSYLYITSPGDKNGAIWGGEDLFCGRTWCWLQRCFVLTFIML